MLGKTVEAGDQWSPLRTKDPAKAEEERDAVAEHKRPGRRTAPASRRESASIRGADGLDRGNGRG